MHNLHFSHRKEMTTLPGSVGWPITGDRTIEFARNPVEFVHGYVKKCSSRVFQTRLLNKPHAFVTTSQGVKEILEGTVQHKKAYFNNN